VYLDPNTKSNENQSKNNISLDPNTESNENNVPLDLNSILSIEEYLNAIKSSSLLSIPMY